MSFCRRIILGTRGTLSKKTLATCWDQAPSRFAYVSVPTSIADRQGRSGGQLGLSAPLRQTIDPSSTHSGHIRSVGGSGSAPAGRHSSRRTLTSGRTSTRSLACGSAEAVRVALRRLTCSSCSFASHSLGWLALLNLEVSLQTFAGGSSTGGRG